MIRKTKAEKRRTKKKQKRENSKHKIAFEGRLRKKSNFT